MIGKSLGSVLAIDADPNSCLADNLGVADPETIVGICEEISKNLEEYPQASQKTDL